MTTPLPEALRAPQRTKLAVVTPAPARTPFAVAGVDDVLVFKHSGGGFSLIGGAGRGAGWAGIVELDAREDSLVARAWLAGTPCRMSGSRARQVAGPYHARDAVAVPVGGRYVVVLGAGRPIEIRYADLARVAATAVDEVHGVPADKLLADELELVHAVRALMAYRPINVRDTVRHVATVAAESLSCDVAVIRVDHDGRDVIETINLKMPLSSVVGPAAGGYLAEATQSNGPAVEQVTSPGDGAGVFGIEVASRMALPLGIDRVIGALAVGHAAAQPRGFTSLCQRIGRALAEAADLLISQAMAREELAAERDLMARISGTDALTGIANRRAWDEAAAALRVSLSQSRAFVLSCDLDGLKAANDRYGHAAGDALIRATATLLRSCVRDSDLVARVGGDEFTVLLRDTDDRAAVAARGRIRRAERMWRVTAHALRPRLSIGLAAVVDNDLEAARHAADTRMYANKRRRAVEARASNARALTDRRAARTGRPVS